MKTHFILAGCLGLMMWSCIAQGQNLVWAKQLGGTLNDYGHSITVDAAGKVYVVGTFSGSADFDPGLGTFNLSSSGASDIFIAKFDVFGSLIWAKRLGSSLYDFGLSVAVDTFGNVYATGLFEGTADFDPGSGTLNLTSPGGSDAFVIKLDVSGSLVWAKQLGGADNDRGHSITIDAYGNVFIAGWFRGMADFDPGSGTLNFTSAGYSDVFITKLDPSGSLIWAKQFGGTGDDAVRSITVDGAGYVYSIGDFQNTADFDPGSGTLNLTSAGNYDVFIVKLDASGNLIWAKNLGGSSYDLGACLTVAPSGNIYAIGHFEGTADFDPGSGTFNLTSSGAADVFITRLNASGDLIWAKQFSGSGSDYGYSIVIDDLGNAYTIGNFSSTVDFDPGPQTLNLNSSGGFDIFITKLDATGNLVWAKQFGGAFSDEGRSIALNAAGNIYATGLFQGTANFDPGPGTFNLNAVGNLDGFTLRLIQSAPTVAQGNVFGDVNTNCNSDASDISLPGILIKAEPGPFYGMSDSAGNYSINLFDTGSYAVSAVLLDTLWRFSCSTSYNINVTLIPDTATSNDFAMTASSFCQRLTVELGTSRLRRCVNNTLTIRYANTGTLPAPNAYIEVDFGDKLQPQNSTIPWSTFSGNIYTFPVGNLNINQQGLFNVTALLNCNVTLGSTQCITAHIYPDSVCGTPNIGWDKSETKVTGGCVNDSLVCFMIKNRSSPPSGNMQGTAPWRLYINDTLVTQGNYQLAGQDSLIQCYPANGKTYRLEADQRLGHPGNSHPQAIVEGCGSPANFGFVNTVAQDDEDLFVETFCMEVRGSFDPNDKQVFPTGITANKYIKPDAELEYLIRFQNTGNDTAFKVVIRDTIQTDVIDIATVVSGASSHDYTFNIYGHGIAEWTFDNILLPDSNVNEPESHGFVKFKAKLLPNITPGTIVSNSADIYFDFNAPVITNEVWNTVFDTVLRAPVIISGTVLTESNTPVAGVTVKLAGSVTDSTITAADGRYGFEVEPGGNYTITPSKNNDAFPNKGLTTYDILTIRKHLLAIGALPSPYKIISASEVNAETDTSITTQDIVLIRSLILGNTSSFPGSRLWQFVSSDYLFPDLQHPFPFNKARTYTNLLSNQINQNFIGIKLGDVNESWEE